MGWGNGESAKVVETKDRPSWLGGGAVDMQLTGCGVCLMGVPLRSPHATRFLKGMGSFGGVYSAHRPVPSVANFN